MSALKQPAQVRGSQREMAEDGGWLMRRTKRVEELLAVPEVMQLADELALHVERYAAIEEVPVKDLEVTILPTQTKRYITINFGAGDCPACNATGRTAGGAYCSTCDGAGTR